MALVISPQPWLVLLDDAGRPVPNGQLAVYEAGTSTPVTVYADIFNALNNDTITSVQTNVGGASVLKPPPATAGSTAVVPYNGPLAVTAPRQIQVGARWTF